MEIIKITILFFSLALVGPLSAQSHQINFAVNMQSESAAGQVGVRGDVPPLSWEKTFLLNDEDQDGIFTGTIILKGGKKSLQFKFVKNNSEFELYGDDNRVLPLNQPQLQVEESFNVLRPLSASELENIRFEAAAVKEDIAVLKRALQTIHPNLYRYIDSLELEQEFTRLEETLIAQNDLPSAYKYITQLIAKIQCSHTITNPWNQKPLIKQAFYYQPDKLPFTFEFVNGRMFVDRNASEEERLRRGIEVLSINGIEITEILSRLTPYISADGNNDAKRIYQLQLNGMEKFEAFDIVFPLEFGSRDQFSLNLKDHQSGKVFTTEVNALTKSRRLAQLQEHYQDLKVADEDLWVFEILNEQSAYLKLGTFSIWNMEMDWKNFLKDAFQEINKKEIPNLLIDIRGNEGGADEVYQFILERLVQEPIQLERERDKVGYRRIPDDLRPYIHTWDQSAFDFGNAVEQQSDGYFLQKKHPAPITYKPRKDGYGGNTFLITDAANSSATHLMAGLMKKYKLGQLVGQDTGGNQKGLNGGMIFFTTLPNTRIEVDIPIFGRYTSPETPNGGIVPDIPVRKEVDDFILGRDSAMEAIQAVIREKSND